MARLIKAWHFVGEMLRDGRPVPPDGEWLVHEGEVKMCRSGLHASRGILDALEYAPGSTICRVVMDDVVEERDDKLVARKRKILWRVDGEKVLRKFTRICALDVIHLWEAPDAMVRFLKTGDAELWDAAYTAWDSMVISGSVCHSAMNAWNVVLAARDAERSVGRAAVYTVGCAIDASKYARRAIGFTGDVMAMAHVSWDAQNKRLTRMVNKAVRL